MEFDQRDMQKKAALMGLIFGLIALVTGIGGLYIVASSSSIAGALGFQVLRSFVIPLSLAVLFAIILRKQIGGYWSFRQATSGIFLLFFTAYFVYSLGDLGYKQAVDSTLETKALQNTIKVTVDFVSKQKMPTDQLDDKITQMEEAMEASKHVSPGAIAQGMLAFILIIFVVSLVFAAIFKREQPLFEEEEL